MNDGADHGSLSTGYQWMKIPAVKRREHISADKILLNGSMSKPKQHIRYSIFIRLDKLSTGSGDFGGSSSELDLCPTHVSIAAASCVLIFR